MIETIATIVSLTAAALLSIGNDRLVKYSMLLWIKGSILWIIIGYQHHLIGLIAVNVGYLVFEGIGLYKWVRRDWKT